MFPDFFCPFLALPAIALAARPFLNEPDTGFQLYLGNSTPAEASGTLIDLDHIVSIPDFDFAARSYLPKANYSYYRTGVAGEYTYRENLDTFNRVKIRPRMLHDITNVENTLNTTILGYNFSAPFFISPAAYAGYGNVDAEAGLVKGAYAGDILYIPSLFATLSIEEIAALKGDGQITFQQLYVRGDKESIQKHITRAEDAGSKAIVWSVDNAWDSARARRQRWNPSNYSWDYPAHTWDLYEEIKNMTTLPVIPKGIQTVEDALLAVEHNAPAIFVSNHGGRQLDTSQSTMEVILEIYKNAPQVLNQTEVLADCGVRYGTDVLKLLAMGVKAVGMGRPFMYANVYGEEGVAQLIEMMKGEIIADAGNMGIADLSEITPAALNLKWMEPYIYQMGS